MLVAELFLTQIMFAQEADSLSPAVDTAAVYTYVPQMPVYPGGDQSRRDFIAANTKYPLAAGREGVQGIVYISFVVDKAGTIKNAKVERGIGSGCDEEALRVVNLMPRWEPGLKDGVAVNVKIILPVSFRIENITASESRDSLNEKMPEYPGGVEALYRYISRNIILPASVESKNVSGRVYVAFVVDTTGAVKDVKIEKGLNTECDKEALRLVNSLPNWIPATQNGKKVQVAMRLPINFGASTRPEKSR